MNISRILKFLISGIVIGAVLFFAGFGVMNLLNKSPESPTVTEAPPAPEVNAIAPPTIEVTTLNEATSQGNTSAGTSNQPLGTGSSPIKIKPLNSSNESDVSLEPGEQAIQAVEFGTLTLSTINSINGAATNSDFLIENSQGVAIALVKDTSSSTLSLPVGDYKITVSNAGQKIVRFLGVKTDKNGAEVFEMDVPVLDGEALVTDAAAPDSQVNVTSETGAEVNAAESSEDPSVESPEVTDSEVVVLEDNTSNTGTIELTESTEQQTKAIGGLRLSALTEQGKRPTEVSFTVQRLSGELVETIQNVKTQQLSLPAGKYRVTAKTATSSVVKEIEVLATRGVHEIFLISSTGTQQTSPVTPASPSSIAPVSESSNTNGVTAPTTSSKPGQLELFAQNATNNSPVKSNFYVQMPNGKMVASKVYVDSIGYKLAAGQYKVIVRATGFKDESVMLNVRPDQTRRETFKLKAIKQQPVSQATPSASSSATQNAVPAYGGLTVNIVSASDRSALLANIVITQRDGTPLKQAFGVASASFDLPPREFVIRVTYRGFTTNHPVNIVKGKLAIKTISIDTKR